MKLKIFALVLVLAMMAGMLVACKKDDGPGNGGNDDIIVPEDTWYDSVWWEPDTFIFRLQENSNYQELPSTCARYLAGNVGYNGIPEGERADDIDDMVTLRNAAASALTKVTPQFTYITDDEDKGWSMNINDMVSDMSNFKPGVHPDAYCNFVYDMVCASLQGAFANLKTETLKTEGQQSGQKGNYFRFVDPKFKDTGEGYMVEYMRSLSLSRTKQYCLSSDYFTDMVRAFFVVPVNLNLLGTFSADGEYGDFNYDYDGDGYYTVEDFYEYVYEYRWTYDTLAEISDLGFYTEGQTNTTGNENGCLHDRLIWAMGESSGLSSSGMLYTTSVTVIERELTELVDGNGNKYTDYVYSYPTENQDLYDFCDKMTTLMSEYKGIISISNDQALGYYTGERNQALLAIRDRFANDRILFGGDICLGSLEYSEYREMEGEGFGIVPVPLFRTEHQVKQDDGTVVTVKDTYMTQIHNIGRIGGINAKTLKFAKISAYLDYQSMYSTEILREYYDFKLCLDVAGGGSHVAMLDFIRSDVRTSFDKAFEDAIGRLFATEGGGGEGEGSTSEKQKWHAIIMDGHFKVDAGQMATYYATYVGTTGEGTEGGENKPSRLDTLEKSYIGLPS